MADEFALNGRYADFIRDLKQRIAAAQIRASVTVNREPIALYRQIGRDIVAKQQEFGWGSMVIDHLGRDLSQAFPGVSGFGRANLFRMRAFYLAYPDVLGTGISGIRAPAGSGEIVAQAVRQTEPGLIEPLAAIGNLSWGHNVVLIEKIKDPDRRLWYAEQAVGYGWSRSVLIHQIESDLYGRQGAAVTNFAAKLPAPDSDLAQQITKDPYIFDFLSLGRDAKERELHTSLIENIQQFLLELGKGFAFVASQYHLDVGGQDFYVDLLFYHARLHCYVAIDLKSDDFKPEYAGKMNFYLSAIDDLVKTTEDGPSIGMVICRSRNKTIVEYSLRDTAKPIGVAEYKISQSRPREIAEDLPSADDLARFLQTAEDAFSAVIEDAATPID